MVKISFGGYDDGEGPSNPTQKRRRVEQQDQEQQEQQEGSEIEDQPSGTEEEQEGEDDDGSGEHAPADYETVVGSNAGRGDTSGPATDDWDRDRSISVTITDPDVLDCCICYEPLSAPVFQVSFPFFPTFFFACCV